MPAASLAAHSRSRQLEVEVATAAGQHRYVVAIDINAAQHN
jgi:hypothetical protein